MIKSKRYDGLPVRKKIHKISKIDRGQNPVASHDPYLYSINGCYITVVKVRKESSIQSSLLFPYVLRPLVYLKQMLKVLLRIDLDKETTLDGGSKKYKKKSML